MLSNAVRVMRRGLVGNARPLASDEGAQAAWDAWAKSCGYRHCAGNLASIFARAAQGLVQDGEVFIQRVYRDNAMHPNGLLLQVWPARLLDRGIRLYGSEADEVDGIEFSNGLPVAAYFRAASSEASEYYKRVRIPFRDLIWLRYAPEGDQLAGTPPMHAAIESDAQLGDFAQTALVQQRIAACTSAMILADDGPLSTTMLELGPRVEDCDGNVIEELQPGTFPIIRGAKDVKTLSPDQVSFPLEEQIARVAAGTGLLAELIAGRMGAASYSAARHALLQRDELIDELMDITGWTAMQQQIVEWWREAELLAARDWADVTFSWLPKGRQSIDPQKTVEAEKVEIELGIKSRAQAIRERGRNPVDVFAEVEQEKGNMPTQPEEQTPRRRGLQVAA